MMKTKSYTKVLGVLLAIVSVCTLFFNWVSAARYVNNLKKLATSSFDFLPDAEYPAAAEKIMDGIDELDDVLDYVKNFTDNADAVSSYFGIPAGTLRSFAKKVTRCTNAVKDFALSPRDVALIAADSGSLFDFATKYSLIDADSSQMQDIKTVKTVLVFVTVVFWVILLLGIGVVVMRVLGKSKGLDVVYFILMLLLAAAFIVCTIAGNKKLEINVLRLTLWPFIGVLCALPMKLLPNIKRTAATAPALVCANCGGKLEASERFCSHCGAPVSQAKQETAASVCPTCGASVGDGYAFCPNCGSPVERHTASGWVCPDCGVTLEDNVNFCPTCGHPKI